MQLKNHLDNLRSGFFWDSTKPTRQAVSRMFLNFSSNLFQKQDFKRENEPQIQFNFYREEMKGKGVIFSNPIFSSKYPVGILYANHDNIYYYAYICMPLYAYYTFANVGLDARWWRLLLPPWYTTDCPVRRMSVICIYAYHAYIYIYMYVCTYVCICAHARVSICMHEHKRAWTFVGLDICMDHIHA